MSRFAGGVPAQARHRPQTPGGTSRMFVAVEPEPAVLDDLAAFTDPRRGAGEATGLRWVRPEQWHVTLAFLPEVDDRHLDELVERLGAACAKGEAARLRFTGAGAFPDPSRARVLYAALEPQSDADADEVRGLAVRARAAAAKAGVPVEGGHFTPHVTLGRFRQPVEATRWLRVFEAYAGPWWSAASVALVESHLGQGPGGSPRYETRERWTVGEGPTALIR